MEGRKFSSSRQVVIYVRDFLARYDADALRYFIAVAGPENQDTDFTWAEFLRRNNDELVAGWGNLVNRTVSMAAKNVGAVPTPGELTDADRALLATTSGAFAPVGDLLSRNRQKAAINEAMRVVGEANKYLSDQAPWKLKEDPARRDTVLHTALQAIKDCNALLTPFLPHSSQQVHELLGGTGVWSVAPEIHEVTDLDDGSPYPIITGPYDQGQAVWASTPLPPSGHAAGAADAGLHQARPVDRRGGAAGGWRRRRMSRSASSRANRRGEPPPSPEPLPAPALDSHTHLDIVLGERPAGDEHGEWASDDDVDAEIAAAAAVNVPRLVQVGRRRRRRPGGRPRSPPGTRTCWPPSRCTRTRPAPGKATDDALAEIDRLAALPRVRAVGETGLDRYRTGPEGWAAQEASFRAHIRIAKEHGVALVIHDRDAHEEILARARRRGRPRAHRLPLLLRRRRLREGLRRARLRALLRRHAHLRQRRLPARGGRADPGRPAAGRDRRALPHPDAAPRPPERLPAGAAHRARPRRGHRRGPRPSCAPP